MCPGLSADAGGPNVSASKAEVGTVRVEKASTGIDLLPPMNGWDSLALAIPGGMPTEGNLPTAMVVLRFAGSASARFSKGLVRLPVTGLSARGTLAPSVRRHGGSTVVFSRVAAGRAIGLTAISSLV